MKSRIRIDIKTICRFTTEHSGDFQPISCVWIRGEKNRTFLTKKNHPTRPNPDPHSATPGIDTGVGHTVGIMVDAGGRLHLLVNGVDQGVAAEQVPDR
jgi:hypothetical protein